MSITLEQLETKQRQLMAAMPISVDVLAKLNHQYKLDLAFNSTALSGKNITVDAAKEVVENWQNSQARDLIETHNHALAWEYVRHLANTIKTKDISQAEILHIHRILMNKVDSVHAGQYRTGTVRNEPNEKVNVAMAEMVQWLNGNHTKHPVQIAADAHLKLITIHPFVEANCRTARLLMNLILLQNGYPPAVIRVDDQSRYVTDLEVAQADAQLDDYYQLIFEATDRSLNLFLSSIASTASTELPEPAKKTRPRKISNKLLKIGQVAAAANETIATIRFWTEEGLIPIYNTSVGGYQLYQTKAVDRAREIRRLQTEKRMSIKELKNYKF
ncbi:MAG: Fic family protein [Patescibacteria group bacterium]|jgi:Fic family protein